MVERAAARAATPRGCESMAMAIFADKDIPYFAWDRCLTVADIRQQLAHATGPARLRLASWILREAKTEDVWQFMTPQEVAASLSKLLPFLGKRRAFWQYLIGAWRELGRI